MKVFSEESALQLSEMLLQNDKDIKTEIEGKIPSVEGLASEKYVDSAVKNVKPDLDGYATETYVNNAIANAQLGGGDTEVDLSGYATKDDLKGYAAKEHTHDEYLTEHQDLSAYAKKADVPNLDGYATEQFVNEALQDVDVNLDDYYTKSEVDSAISNAQIAGGNVDLTDYVKTETMNTALADKADVVHTHDQYLTEHQSLVDYALKTDIPTDYLTAIPDEYVTETEMNEAIAEAQLGGSESTNTKNILGMPLTIKPIPQTDTSIGVTKTTRYVKETSTSISNPITVPSVIDGIINPKLMHIYGCHTVQVIEGSETPTDYYVKPDDNGLHSGSMVLSFGFNGDEIEIIIHSYASVRILVDDGSGYKYTSNEEELWLKGTYDRVRNVAVKLNFGSAKQRNIIMEMGLSDEFGGFIYNRIYNVTPIIEKKPLACFIGSSLTDGQGKHITWSRHVCHRLGLEWLNVAQGATGFVNDASGYGGRDKVRNRMPLIYPKKPWLLTLEGSYNDMGGGISVTAFKEELNLLFTEVKENLPNCLTIVIGTFTPCRDLKSSGHWDAKNDALREVALQHNLPFIDGLNGKVYDSNGNILSSGESWLTGSGNASAPKGDGNSDLYVISDSTHFNDAGNTYLGELITSAISEIIYSEKVASEISTETVFNLSKNFIVLDSGSSVGLTYFPTTTTPTFVSSNDSIATVTADGTVSGVADGVVMISATVNGVTDTCVVNVVSVVERGNVIDITATKTQLNYSVGDTITTDDIEVIATYENGSTAKVTTWTTNADSIDMSTSGTKTLTVSYEGNGVTVTTDIALSVTDEPVSGDVEPIMLNVALKNDGTVQSTETPRMYLFKLEKDTTYYLNVTAESTAYIRTAFSDTELEVGDVATVTPYYKDLKNQVIQAPSNMTNFYVHHSSKEAVITLSTQEK